MFLKASLGTDASVSTSVSLVPASLGFPAWVPRMADSLRNKRELHEMTGPRNSRRKQGAWICSLQDLPFPLQARQSRPLSFIAGLCKQSLRMDTGHGCASSLHTFHSQTEPQPGSSGKLAERNIFHALDSSGCAGALQPFLPIVTHTQKAAVIQPPLSLKSLCLSEPQGSSL